MFPQFLILAGGPTANVLVKGQSLGAHFNTKWICIDFLYTFYVFYSLFYTFYAFYAFY
jgi:hypothetical protein